MLQMGYVFFPTDVLQYFFCCLFVIHGVSLFSFLSDELLSRSGHPQHKKQAETK